MPSRFELANAIRALSMDAVQKAKSGHPGAPMGMADIAEVLWNDYLKHNPEDPKWADRDRFVLMAEVWHPSLTEPEREALATTFAVKDRFTVTKLRQCPWGFGDDELERAIQTGHYKELDFWKRCSFGLDGV